MDLALKAAAERALLLAAHECDDLHVHEEGGANKGKRIEMYLRLVWLRPGNPWCAAAVAWCLWEAGWFKEKGIELLWGLGAVRNWASRFAHLVVRGGANAKRGYLFFWLNPNGTGHMGFVCETRLRNGAWWIRTLEGNSNEFGGREGDRWVRKWRRVSSKMRFIRLY